MIHIIKEKTSNLDTLGERTFEVRSEKDRRFASGDWLILIAVVPGGRLHENSEKRVVATAQRVEFVLSVDPFIPPSDEHYTTGLVVLQLDPKWVHDRWTIPTTVAAALLEMRSFDATPRAGYPRSVLDLLCGFSSLDTE